MRYILQRDRENELLELSEDTAAESNATGRVCPTQICTAKEIKIVHDAFGAGKFDGMLVYRKGKWVILCNSDNGNAPGSTRERFTISHELGHYHILEHRRQLLAGCPSHGSFAGAFDGADSIEELEADIFAANLLMPPARFISRIRAIGQLPLQSILKLRKEFDTSLESTAIQAMRHDDRILAIAKWNSDGLEWHRIADPFFKEFRYRRFQMRDLDKLPRDSATAEALADSESQYNGTVHDTLATTSFCFDYVALGGNRDILLREQAVRNGRFGVVTIYSILNPEDIHKKTGISR